MDDIEIINSKWAMFIANTSFSKTIEYSKLTIAQF